jgi:hypothetical protein
MTLRNFKLAMSSALSLALGGLASLPGAVVADESLPSRGFGDDRRFELEHDSLIISSSTYERNKGAVATTVGLRNLAGVVNRDGTVTLWATTSTSSTSGDAGADPNKVVRITDRLAATSLTGSAAEESFVTIAGPTYGKVYRGVAYAE